MKKLLLLTLAVTLTFSLASAQNKIVFGPLAGDDAGQIIATNGAAITVPVFIRTAPGIDVVGLHIPLSSNNAYVASRDGGAFLYPLLPGVWDDVGFLPPNADGAHPGYTNQSILGVKDLIGDPSPEDGIQTEGAWWQVAEFHMTTTVGNPFDVPYCDAFLEGTQPENGGMVWADFYTGEMDQDQIEKSFACLQFTDNTDPEWTVFPGAGCGDAGMTSCFDLAGTDADAGNDLHIVQTGGPGTYTESVGGPGGYTAGTWCGTLAEGDYLLRFELQDNSGGTVPLDVPLTVGAISMDIADVSGFPGGSISVPVNLSTCAFLMGGMELFIGWDPTAISLTGVTPTGRIDNGHEYFHVNFSDPCQQCPDDDAVRVTWISDINNGVPHAPAYPGNDPIIVLHFDVADDLPWGMVIPINFLIPHYSDNTISDPSGYTWLRPELFGGSINVIDPSTYKGDPNMNGFFYEVGDAVLVARRLISGYVVWSENGSGDDGIQEASGDLNNNGVVDVADLVRFINIINGTINPPKLDPASAVAEISVSSVIEDNIEVTINSGLEVGGVLLSISHSGVEIGTPIANGMDFLAVDKDGVLNVVVYSLEGNTLAAGNSTVITIPVISNDNGSVEIVEASSADAYGRLLETTASVITPLPTAYSVAQNYPNPFNAKTLISFDLPNGGAVTVDIYSVTGQLVESVSGNYEAGTHSITWDASNVASGIYFYKVSAGDFSQTMKMTLLK
jgi:hypothetical protein